MTPNLAIGGEILHAGRRGMTVATYAARFNTENSASTIQYERGYQRLYVVRAHVCTAAFSSAFRGFCCHRALRMSHDSSTTMSYMQRVNEKVNLATEARPSTGGIRARMVAPRAVVRTYSQTKQPAPAPLLHWRRGGRRQL